MSAEAVSPAVGDPTVATGGDEGQKKRRLEAPEPSGDAPAAATETTEADYKNRLKRLLKMASPDVVLDILATM